jgi:flagellar motility protein MotE (MotC chaperone)
MKKFMPVMRLLSILFFCAATFALSFGALLLKEGKLFPKKGSETKDPSVAQKPDEGDDGAASGDAAGDDPARNGGDHPREGGDHPRQGGESAKASIDGASGAGGERRGEGRAPKGKEAERATRQKAVNAGRALFDVAQPISISDASDLMLELARTKQEYESRKASLDLREKELNQFSAELEQKRTAILKLAGDAQTSSVGAGPTGKSEVLDKKTLTQIGNIFAKMQPQAAAHALVGYPSDRAAQILLNMKDQAVAEILSFVSAADLVKLTDAIGKVKSSPTDEE